MCYDQFNHFQKLAKDYNIQLFVATHWYGALPIIDQGTLHHIQTNDSDAIEIKPFHFQIISLSKESTLMIFNLKVILI